MTASRRSVGSSSDDVGAERGEMLAVPADIREGHLDQVPAGLAAGRAGRRWRRAGARARPVPDPQHGRALGLRASVSHSRTSSADVDPVRHRDRARAARGSSPGRRSGSAGTPAVSPRSVSSPATYQRPCRLTTPHGSRLRCCGRAAAGRPVAERHRAPVAHRLPQRAERGLTGLQPRLDARLGGVLGVDPGRPQLQQRALRPRPPARPAARPGRPGRARPPRPVPA